MVHFCTHNPCDAFMYKILHTQTNKQTNELILLNIFRAIVRASVHAKAHIYTHRIWVRVSQAKKKTASQMTSAFNSNSSNSSNSSNVSCLPIISRSLIHSISMLPDTELNVVFLILYRLHFATDTHTQTHRHIQRERVRVRAMFSKLVCTSCRHILTS